MGFRPASRPGHPYLAGAPILVAHRGGARLAPENTMEAFQLAVDGYDADMLEMDVHLTADGQVVVMHDETVDRTTDGAGAVADLPWDALAELDAGHGFLDLAGAHAFQGRGVRVPRFQDVLEAFPHIRINVECKCARVARPLVAMILHHGAQDRVLVAAGEEGNRRAARGYTGPWGASRRQLRRFYLLHRIPAGSLYTPRADALQIPEVWKGRRILTPRFLEEAHRRNLPVHVWTVDEEADMRRLLEMGVDAIQTDRRDRLARVLHQERGRPLPPGLAPKPETVR